MAKQSKYQQLAEIFSKQITEGYFQPGDRIPSVRVTCEQYQLSMTTVQSAFQKLEGEGLIQSRPGAGYFVTSLSLVTSMSLTEPQGLSVHNRMLDVLNACSQKGIINLGTAVIDTKLLPVNQLRSLLSKLTRYHMDELVSPQFSSGYAPLRRQFSKKMLNVGAQLHPDDILITGGCQDAISLALAAVVKAGEVIAVESPCFPGLLQVIESLNMKAIEIPSSPQTGMDMGELEKALNRWDISAVVIVPSYSNPTGSLMPLSERQRLIDMSKKHQLPIIEDDLFSELNYTGKPLVSLKSLDRDGYVIYCSSVSKSLGSGFRLGWMCGGQYHEEIKKLKAFRNVSEPMVIQMLITAFFKSGGYERHQKRLKAVLSNNFKLMSQSIKQFFPEGTLINASNGGYMIWVSLPKDCDSRVVFEQAIKRGVSFFPGDLFSQNETYVNYLRINLAIEWSDNIESGIKVIGELCKAQLQYLDDKDR